MAPNTETIESMISARGLTWSAASEKSGVARSSLWRWNNGGSTPRHAQALALARILKRRGEKLETVVARVIAASRRAGAKPARARAAELART